MASNKAGGRVPNDRPENYVFDGCYKVLNLFNIGIDPGYDAENLSVKPDHVTDPPAETITIPKDPRAKRR